MNMLDMILGAGAQNGDVVKQLANNFGISENDVQGAIGKLVPALSQGIKREAETPEGMGALVQALQKGGHSRYIDNPSELQNDAALTDGNAILGHILGSKDVSRNLADRASSETGVDSGILKQMLPMLAGLAMGAMGKQTSGDGALSGLTQQGGSNSTLGMLTSFLDADKDGSIVDDLLGMAKRFF